MDYWTRLDWTPVDPLPNLKKIGRVHWSPYGIWGGQQSTLPNNQNKSNIGFQGLNSWDIKDVQC